MTAIMLLSLLTLAPTSDDPPVVKITGDDTVIDRSCRVVIAPGTVIEDRNDDGVIHVAAPDITIEFAPDSRLRGAKPGVEPDAYRGYGIRVAGHKNVTIRGARVSGYWCGVWATGADGLTIEDADASDCRRARLKSTPVAEDGSDWLFPHNNDQNEWLRNYGAAIYVEDSTGVTVRRCRVRHGQNALCLDRVRDSKVYDNDLSFNSGWGIALWRCERNVISRNAADFCVRGYSHGVYNRGQDSAGILAFEQNNGNVFAENSATHGGDGFFGFAGREAIGEAPPPTADFGYRRRGNKGNVLVKNDFSYAPAHGIEMTFSFGNQLLANRLVGNAICGVWGGYSQDTLIAGNAIEDNGEMGYGLERGGVNIEHGRGNRILSNTFRGNRCGVHLWWDPDGDFVDKPWGKANGHGSYDNEITDNAFTGDRLAFHFRLARDPGRPDAGRSEVLIGPNKFDGVEKEMDAEDGCQVRREPKMKIQEFQVPTYPVYGDTRPVGARIHLGGRENIVMTEWGPWDHESPLVRLVEATGRARTYDLHKMPSRPDIRLHATGLAGRLIDPASPGGPPRYEIKAAGDGVFPYRMTVASGDFKQEYTGTILAATWRVTSFPWTIDPREDLDGWRKESESSRAATGETDRLTLKFGHGGPSDVRIADAITAAKIGGDHFGVIARTRLTLPAGDWKFTTVSDDGVRVTVDGKPVIDNWTWHVPTRDEGVFKQSAAKPVDVVVEHFEIDGFATLEFDLTRAN